MSTLSTKVGLGCCLAGAALGGLGVLAHALGMGVTTGLIAGRPLMVPITGLSLLSAGLAAALHYRAHAPRVVRAVSILGGSFVLGIGVLTLLEYVLPIDTGTDWTLPGNAAAGPYPGRPSPLTSAAFVPLGAALLLFHVRVRRVEPREWLALAVAFTAFVSLVGHALGAGPLYQVGEESFIGVALSTAIALSLISLGILAAPPQVGILRLALSKGPGGVMVRRLGLAVAVVGPLLGASLLALVQRIELHDLPLTVGVGVVLAVSFALAGIAITARSLDLAHEHLEQTRERLFQLVAQAPDGVFVADVEGRYIDVNEAACRLLGYSREELLKMTIVDLIRPDEVDRLSRNRERLLQGETLAQRWRLRRKDGSEIVTDLSTRMLADGRWQAIVRDVTERVRIERELVESRDFLQGVLESSTGYAIVAEDLDGKIILWNPGAQLAYGYSDQQILGQPTDLLVTPEDLGAFRALRAAGLATGKAEGAIRSRRRDRSTFLSQAVCTRRVGVHGDAVGVLVVARDLTAEQRHLAEQEFLARAGVELAPCLDAQTVLAAASRLATDFLGEMCVIDVLRDGSLDRAAVHHADPSQAHLVAAMKRIAPASSPKSLLWRVLETQTPVVASDPHGFQSIASSDEMRLLFSEINARSTMMIPMIARGQLLAVLTVISCKPERTYAAPDLLVAEDLARRAALALDNVRLYQESRLQGAVTTNLAEGVILVRQRDWAIVYANPRFEAMFGYAPGELLGKPVAIINAPSEHISPEAAAAAIVAELEREGLWHGEIANLTKNGTILWSQASVSTFQHEAHGTVWIAVHTDITERKRLEDANARALREKEALLREIHHRVKNNLQVISSLFSLQRSRTDNEALRALLDESRSRVQSIALVHEHLYRSASLAAIDLDSYLRGLVGSIRATYGNPPVTIDLRVTDVDLDADRAVPAALLIGELVSNAFKHAFAGGAGTITIRAFRDEQRHYVFEVADNGRGMPESFDWQKASSLGLRLVRIFAKQLQGTIAVDRTSGTRFVIRFPSAESPPASASEPLPVASA